MKMDETLTPQPPRKKMSAGAFQTMWKEQRLVQTNEHWEDYIKFTKHSPDGSFQVELSNIEVDGDVQIEQNSTPLPHLILINCHLSNLTFKNAKALSITATKNSIVGDIWITQSHVGNLSIRDNSKGWIFTVKTESAIGDVVIGDNSKVENFAILDNSQTGNFSIWGNSEVEKIGVHRNSQIKKVWLQKNSKVGDIGIYERSKAEDFQILSVSSIRDFALEDSMIGNFEILENSTTKNFKIENSISGKFDIKENSNTGSFSFENSQLEDFKIRESYTESIIFKGGTVNEIVITYAILRRIEIIRNCAVKRFRCRLPLQNPAQITFSKSSFREIDFDNTVLPEFATLQTTHCKINQLSFHNFCNFGAIFLSDLEVHELTNSPSTLRLTDSDLGKMQFINCDLRQFERFEFSNTKMLDVFVAGSQMPDDEAFRLPNDEQNSLKIAEQKRLAYGQFKKIYEARGDVAGSLPYLAYEMEAYLDELNLKSKNWRDHFGERWMLRVNRYSTNHGNNWLLGAKRTFWAIVICYSLFCLSHGLFPGTDVARFLEIASYAPQYLNPFRDADSVIPETILPELPDWWKKWILPFSRLIDYFSRIIVAYFIYQTIQAFRKLGKSSG